MPNFNLGKNLEDSNTLWIDNNNVDFIKYMLTTGLINFNEFNQNEQKEAIIQLRLTSVVTEKRRALL